MARSRALPSALLALFCAGAAGGCVSQKSGASLVQVDQLVTAIERVDTGTTLAQERLHDALLALKGLVALDFGADVPGAYAATDQAITAAGAQITALDGEVKKMKSLADPMFKRWAADLDTFESLELRLKSQNRLAQTRQRYDAIVQSVEPAQAAFGALHKQLADCTLFLKHDLNASACAALRPDVAALSLATQELDAQLLACGAAAKDYVESVALPAPVAEPATTPPAAAPATKPTTKPAAAPAKPAATPAAKTAPKANG